MALMVGLFSKLPDGEYSRRSRVGLSTSIRASPERTMADWCAMPSAMSTGVARLTGAVSLRDGPGRPDAAAHDGQDNATAVNNTAVTTNPIGSPRMECLPRSPHVGGLLTLGERYRPGPNDVVERSDADSRVDQSRRRWSGSRASCSAATTVNPPMNA